jgi:hypothetical protein
VPARSICGVMAPERRLAARILPVAAEKPLLSAERRSSVRHANGSGVPPLNAMHGSLHTRAQAIASGYTHTSARVRLSRGPHLAVPRRATTPFRATAPVAGAALSYQQWGLKSNSNSNSNSNSKGSAPALLRRACRGALRSGYSPQRGAAHTRHTRLATLTRGQRAGFANPPPALLSRSGAPGRSAPVETVAAIGMPNCPIPRVPFVIFSRNLRPNGLDVLF